MIGVVIGTVLAPPLDAVAILLRRMTTTMTAVVLPAGTAPAGMITVAAARRASSMTTAVKGMLIGADPLVMTLFRHDRAIPTTLMTREEVPLPVAATRTLMRMDTRRVRTRAVPRHPLEAAQGARFALVTKNRIPLALAIGKLNHPLHLTVLRHILIPLDVSLSSLN